jgi:hypothetical protein
MIRNLECFLAARFSNGVSANKMVRNTVLFMARIERIGDWNVVATAGFCAGAASGRRGGS